MRGLLFLDFLGGLLDLDLLDSRGEVLEHLLGDLLVVGLEGVQTALGSQLELDIGLVVLDSQSLLEGALGSLLALLGGLLGLLDVHHFLEEFLDIFDLSWHDL